MKTNHKSNLTTAAVLALTLALLTGCASTGNESLRKETEASVSEKVVEGKTTKEEVRAMFGSPLSTSFTDGGLEIWKYELSKMSSNAINYVPYINLLASGHHGVKKELVIMFDDKGVVKKRSMSESAVNQKTGLLNQ